MLVEIARHEPGVAQPPVRGKGWPWGGIENLASGATIEEFVEWFPGVEERQVRAVLEHEAEALRTEVAR